MSLAVATLLPVYGRDRPDLFARALRSVLNQRLAPDVESRIYLGIDGPLPSELEQVIAGQASRIHRISRAATNLGLAPTLNRLIGELADESFVFRMDADDECLPDRFAKQLAYLGEHPEVAIVGTDIVEVDETHGVERRVSFARDADDAIRRLHRRVPVAHPTACFRRQVFELTGGYPTQHGSNEDVALWFSCARLGLKFGNVHEPLLRFTIGPGFWHRRSLDKAWAEAGVYFRGIRQLHGAMTWRYVYPLARLAVRIAPTSLVRRAYNTRWLRR